MSILKANRIENLTTTDGGINVNNSGNVGVGTSSPGQALDVVGSSGSNTPITWLRSTGNRGYLHSDGGGVGIGSSSTLNDAGIYLVTDTQIGFRVNGSEQMRIDSSGRLLVGLSSTSSTTLLQVEGKSNSGTAHGGILLRRGSAPGTNDALGYVLFGANDSNAPIEIGGFRDGGTWSSGSSMPTRLVFSTTADGASSATERMRITSSGNVEIGNNTGLFIDNTSGTARRVIHIDTDNNLYLNSSPENNSIIFQSGGANERMRIDSSGNVGIGTTSPGDQLHIHTASSGAANVRFSSTDVPNGFFVGFDGQEIGQIWHTANKDIRIATNNTERMRIASNGRVGIGTSSPTQKLTVNNGSDNSDVAVFTGGDNNRGLKISTAVNGGVNDSTVVFNAQTSSTGQFTFETNGSEAMRIDKDGKILLACTSSSGTSDPGVKVSQANNPWLRIVGNESTGTNFFLSGYNTNSTNNGYRFYVMFNGGIANYSGNNSNLSDEREKKNIVSLDSKWDKVKSWELKKFHYNEDADTDDLRYGVIAQQVEEHCPEVLTDWVKQSAEDAVLDGDGNVVTPAVPEIVRKGVKEQPMMWMAIKALQEAQTRIETLETQNTAQQTQIDDLLSRVTALETAS